MKRFVHALNELTFKLNQNKSKLKAARRNLIWIYYSECDWNESVGLGASNSERMDGIKYISLRSWFWKARISKDVTDTEGNFEFTSTTVARFHTRLTTRS